VHDLRHTCASWLVAAGTPLPVVQAHLGHESIQTTIAAYTHLDRSTMSAAATAIGTMLESSSKTYGETTA
jgi:integrase